MVYLTILQLQFTSLQSLALTFTAQQTKNQTPVQKVKILIRRLIMSLLIRIFKVDISQLIRFARASSNLNDFNYRNKALTAKLLRQGYRYFKLRKAFSKFYRKHSALLEKYSVSLKTLLQQRILEPEFYGDLVYRFRKIVGKPNFSEQFRKLINRYKKLAIAWIL